MKWRDLAPPDDPESYYDVDGFWPTNRGSYETADALASSDRTATSIGTPTAAFSAYLTTPSASHGASVTYVVTNTPQIWQLNSDGTATDRVGATSAGNSNAFAQYGDVTIIAQGNSYLLGDSVIAGGSTIAATAGSSFANLAGAPNARCIAVQSNAVVLLNTSNASDGYSISDVGDYTNWTTGESVSGRIIDTPGIITGGVAFAGSVFAYKQSAIYRMTYVGGLVKWRVDKVWDGLGAVSDPDGISVCAGATGMLFRAALGSGTPTHHYYWFDGSSPPVLTNPMTTIGASDSIIYCPGHDVFTVWSGNTPYYFSPKDMAWGVFVDPFGGATPGTNVVRQGTTSSSPTTTRYAAPAANTLRTWSATAATGATYLETTKRGNVFAKSTFSRVIPILRRRSGAGSTTLTLTHFAERHDTAGTAISGIAESSYRKRFDTRDNKVSNYFARAKVIYTNLDVEADDIVIKPDSAGRD